MTIALLLYIVKLTRLVPRPIRGWFGPSSRGHVPEALDAQPLLCESAEPIHANKLDQVKESSQPLLQRNSNKRIALPVRVEPKVFFANERTFLSWLNFTVVLGGLAVGLLNFGDRVGKISAGMFTFVAMAIMIYALVTYHWRAAAIRKRGSGPYDDRVGPTVLCLALLAAIVINFILRFTSA
ncbi:GTPase regulator Nrf1 [Microbotryomycetes sp. JL221]|nr:GTPase regulator Nrf1 [Microbotryomycetes sp. JL221]